MSNIIFSCNSGLATQGLVGLNEPLIKTKIFVDDPINLIGFRSSLRQYFDKESKVQYFEIGYFMEMLYEGSYEAFSILKSKDVDFELYDFDILRKREEDLISRQLIDKLLKQAEELYVGLDDPENLGEKVDRTENKFVLEFLAYNNKNAYLCFRNMMLIESILKNYKFEIKESSISILQGILDGKFSLGGLKEGWELHKGNIEELEKVSNIPLRPDHSFMNEILLDIRNVKIE